MKRILVPIVLIMLILTGWLNNNDKDFITEYYNLELEEGTLYGILTTPKFGNSFPVVLIIQGAGAINRDGNNTMESLTNNHLKMLAEALANFGIASVRFDKRGIGKSSSIVEKPEDLIFEDYIDDAVAWMEKIQKDNRFHEYYILGHGEGGLIGAAAASQVEVDGFISIAAPGEALHETLISLLEAKKGKVSERNLEIINELRKGNMVSLSPKEYGDLFNPKSQPYLISLFKYEPQEVISQVEVPTLIIQGENDLQSSIEDARLLHESKESKLVIIRGMNHI